MSSRSEEDTSEFSASYAVKVDLMNGSSIVLVGDASESVFLHNESTDGKQQTNSSDAVRTHTAGRGTNALNQTSVTPVRPPTTSTMARADDRQGTSSHKALTEKRPTAAIQIHPADNNFPGAATLPHAVPQKTAKHAGGKTPTFTNTLNKLSTQRSAAYPSVGSGSGKPMNTSTRPSSNNSDAKPSARPTFSSIPGANSRSRAASQSRNGHPGHYTIETIDESRVCPVQTMSPECEEGCVLTGVCWDSKCSGRCGKVHGRPCPKFLVHMSTCASGETCRFSHDPRWKEIYKMSGKHEKGLKGQR